MPSRRSSEQLTPLPKDTPSTAADIRTLLAHLLAGVAGGSEAKWAKLVGEVEALPIVFHPRSNWRVQPSGSAEQLAAIEKAIAVVREAHPYVPSPTTLGSRN